MPTPLEMLIDPVSLCIIVMYVILMLWEAFFPARKLPFVPYWRIKGILFFIFYFYLSNYLPLFYSQWLPTSQLIDLSTINVITGSVIGILLFELGMYGWHRSIHRNKWLWKIFHQMHHSAERLDTYGAFFFSPFDMVGFTLLGTACFFIFNGFTGAINHGYFTSD